MDTAFVPNSLHYLLFMLQRIMYTHTICLSQGEASTLKS